MQNNPATAEEMIIDEYCSRLLAMNTDSCSSTRESKILFYFLIYDLTRLCTRSVTQSSEIA